MMVRLENVKFPRSTQLSDFFVKYFSARVLVTVTCSEYRPTLGRSFHREPAYLTQFCNIVGMRTAGPKNEDRSFQIHQVKDYLW